MRGNGQTGKIYDECESYKTALEVLTKEIEAKESSNPNSNRDQLDMNYFETVKRRRPNRNA